MTARPATSPGLRNAAGVLIGLVGTAVAFVLLGDALNGTEPVAAPRPPEAVALTALQMLGGGTALGGVLLAGRRVSPWAPLSSGLVWALGSVAALADPAAVVAELPGAAATLSGHQLGLGLTAVMLLGAVALRPGPAAAARREQLAPEQRLPERDPAPVTPRAVARVGPRRPDGPGPRHRAPRWSPPPVLPRGQGPRRRPS